MAGVRLIGAKVTPEDFRRISDVVSLLARNPDNAGIDVKKYVRYCVVQTTNSLLKDLREQSESLAPAQVTKAESKDEEVVNAEQP